MATEPEEPGDDELEELDDQAAELGDRWRPGEV